jgi:hypothetical protein
MPLWLAVICLPAFAALAAAQGAVSLFDGRSSAGWQTLLGPGFPAQSWEIQNGALCTVENAPRPDLSTVRQFRNFQFDFEFNLAPRTNSGVKYLVFGLRSEKGQPPKALGLEMQLIDESHIPVDKRNPAHGMGALYLYAAPENLPPLPPNEWHRARVVVRGQHIEHWLNGVRVLSTELTAPSLRDAVARQARPDVPKLAHLELLQNEPNRTFPLVLTHHGGRACFRNLQVREQ